MSELLDPSTLAEQLRGSTPPLLVDVRLEEDFQCVRLPKARNNCVFEVAFLERMDDLAPDLNRPVCVYGAAADSLESRMAAEKLDRKGYAGVFELQGGLEGWRAAGLPVDEGPSVPKSAPAITDGHHPVDLAESRVRWVGRNLLNCHEGFIGLKAGSLEVKAGQLVGGKFIFDMAAITCNDLAGTPLHDVLIRHLQDHDFFDTGLYPDATFSISGTTPLPEATPGSPDISVSGILTLKGVSRPIEFVACTGVTDAGKLAAQASFAFDRTKWNVLYGSGKWFRHLGGHLVNDLIELQLRIVSA